jgi:3-methyladenine DNA glycosylase AlkD
MAGQSQELVRYVTSELARAADPSKARAMAAYMKTTQPFYGVPTPLRATILKTTRNRFVPSNQEAYQRSVLALWKLPHRETRYVAIGYARQHREFVAPESLKMYERMIREGAWWDFVDEIAANLVGIVLLENRAAIGPRIARWIDDPDMWIRRTAIISQLRHKSETDAEQLFEHCMKCAHEPEFFIRKAIGWALREYSKSNPRAVRRFIAKNRGRLSNLSVAEGSKYVSL